MLRTTTICHGLVVIHKKPLPIQIVRVDHPQRSRAKIVEAYFEQASTTDYSGFMMDTTSTLKQRNQAKT